MAGLLAVALAAGLPSLQETEAQHADAMQKEVERFAALDRMAANTKAVQDRTKAELARMQHGDFFGPATTQPTSFAQRDPPRGQDFADARADLAKVDAEATAGLDSLDRKLATQEARAQKASLLETPGNSRKRRRKHSKQTPGFHLSPGLVADKADLVKTKALAGALHATRLAAEEQLHDQLRRHEQAAAVEAADEDPGAASLPPLGADERAELAAEDGADDSLLQVGARSNARTLDTPDTHFSTAHAALADKNALAALARYDASRAKLEADRQPDVEQQVETLTTLAQAAASASAVSQPDPDSSPDADAADSAEAAE